MTQRLEQACDSQRIDDYLNERPTSSQQTEFEDHLSRCAWCQQQIQSRAAAPDLWESAVALLSRATKLEHVPPHELEPWNQREEDEPASGFRSRQVQSVLESLTPTDDPEMLGRIGDYEIIGVVGVGGMGAVLKGFDKSLRRVVAIKIMAPHLAGSGSARSRFQREARAAAAITHDNVIDIYSVSEAGGLPYLVMPYARGPSLQKRIDEGGPLSVAEVLRIGRQIAAGLAAAHEQGLVHRDIKPANILLNDCIERLLITDFGVARAMDDASMTRTGVIAGTPQYMSPEQARGEAVDARSDLFSLGSVLYTACTGRPPFRSEAAYGILRRITDDDPRPIREINPDIPDWLCRIVKRLMAKHPADRFPNAAEVSELLEGCLAHLQQPTQVPLPPSLASSSPTETTPPPDARRVSGRGRGRSLFSYYPGVRLMASAFLVAAVGFTAMHVTAPADIAGSWHGEAWTTVSLSSVDEAADWYTGSFTAADGQRGALQLEWSRLQRRYNGRWKVGDGQSGSITLRTGEAGTILGAAAADPDVPAASVASRLWEFTWSRSMDSARRATESPAIGATASTQQMGRGERARQDGLQPWNISSPVKGVLRWGPGIHENAAVKKGQLIAEISVSDPNLKDRLREALASAKQVAAEAQTRLESSEKNLQAMIRIVRASEGQVRSYEAVKEQIVAARESAVGSLRQEAKAKAQLVASEQANLEKHRLNYERKKELSKLGPITGLELQQAKMRCIEAEARVAQSQASLEAVENAVTASLNDHKTEETRAQADVDSANVELAKAVSDVVKAEREVAQAKAALASAQAHIEECDRRLTQPETCSVRAPMDGRVVELVRQEVLKQGDLICILSRELSDGAPNRNDFSQPADNAPAPASSVAEASPSSATQSLLAGNPIAQTFGPVSELARRLREGREKIKTLESQIESDIAASAKLAQMQSHTKEKLAAAQEDMKADDPEVARMAKERLRQSELDIEQLVKVGAVRLASESAARRSLDAARKQLADAEAERDTIIRMLELQLDAAHGELELQKKLAEIARMQYETGELGAEQVLIAEQALPKTAAKVQQLVLLADMYRSLGVDPELPQPEPAAASSPEDPPAGQ